MINFFAKPWVTLGGQSGSWESETPGEETSALLRIDYHMSITKAGGFGVNHSKDSLIIRVWGLSENFVWLCCF